MTFLLGSFRTLSRRLAQTSAACAALLFVTVVAAQCPFRLGGLETAIGTSDGLLFARIAQAIAPTALTNATGASLPVEEIQAVVAGNIARLDINDNGAFDVDDAALIVRYLLGFRGDGLISGSTGASARRKSGKDIQNYIDGGCIPVRYTVSGVIAGLAGGGLELQLNRSTVLSIPANAGSFMFPLLFLPSDSYEVRVRNQPSGLQCTLTNGRGTVGEANVTDIKINCVPPTFTVGGTISGLTNAGLVLRNNGGSPTPIAVNATQFTMPGSFLAGTSYSVTVSTQPAGLTCSVSNGGGTFGAANVTNVQINCVVSGYTVGGTIENLSSAAGLILQNNGGPDIPIPARATNFSLPGTFFPDSPYNITIKSQPLGRTCAISNASGTVGLANVTNVRLACCGNAGLRLPSGGRTQVGYSGTCDSGCSGACSSFGVDCCSEQLLYAGVCTNVGAQNLAICDCTCQ